MRYAELHAHSVYTFLDGANTPAQLVDAACALRLEALAVLDVDGMYSAIQTQSAGRDAGMPIVHGSELSLEASSFARILKADPQQYGWGLKRGAEDPGIRLPILTLSPQGRQHLCRVMSAHTLSHPQGEKPRHRLETLAQDAHDWMILTGSARGPLRRALASGGHVQADRLLGHMVKLFGRDHLAVESTLGPHEPTQLADSLAEMAHKYRLPLVATTGARCATEQSQALSDVLTATRFRSGLHDIQHHLPAMAAFLRSGDEMLRIHHRHPEAVSTAADIARHAAYDLAQDPPGLPHPHVPEGHSSDTWLKKLTIEAAERIYGARESNPQAWQIIDHELAIITALDFSGYFLIVKEIVDFCLERGILCQGRGSAANSAVCYALGITAVDAVAHRLLFERFLSQGRSGPPDIDLDIQSDRREEVIQHVYAHYGRQHAAQVANVISYRPKSAIRDAARALGYSAQLATQWSKGLRDHSDEIPPMVTSIASSLRKLPRHMGIHPGGMVLTRTPVADVCPLNWGSTKNRSVLQWDKDDCADAGLVKFDLLGLGMLAALNTAFSSLRAAGIAAPDGQVLGLHNLPQEDPAVYDLLCAADTVGVFQVESRAQMNTLPRLKPRCFYDIVVEVALIRPGPIQGGSVNPYLRRRQGKEKVTYLHPLLENALEKTLGVPLFQEQLMQIAVDVAGFTPTQADELRRAMGSKRSPERMEKLRPLLMSGMAAQGIDESTATQIYDKLCAFADFGFPESHAFSFAHIVYASAWLKIRYPEYFYAAILAHQPMGFYSPSSLVHDARRHGVAVEGPDVSYSHITAHVRVSDNAYALPVEKETERTIVSLDVNPQREIRLGLDNIKGLGKGAQRIVAAREEAPFTSPADLARRACLNEKELALLAQAGALASLNMGLREGIWASGPLASPNIPVQHEEYQPYIPGIEVSAQAPPLPDLEESDAVVIEHRVMGLSTRAHPITLLRPHLPPHILTIAQLKTLPAGEMVSVVGVITHRQSPPTAAGLTFLSIEDESGLVNVTCSANMWRRYRRVGLTTQCVHIRGRIERDEDSYSVKAHHLSGYRLPVDTRSRDFR
ncbi:error-prone DNA polymerase [Schaalia suimastitidis]|uniref:error-prone DNA polymerase n=1 Tax=Schaalia suimastitidis TaxID=121163 RepID=UPI0004265011|nr:error-prone DNA polymerase [Schaalia suimastitidis]